MIHKIIRHLVPDAKFVMNGDPSNETEYTQNVQWHDDRPQPTWNEIQAAQSNVETKLRNEQAKQARAQAFRTEADPLYFGWQRGENTEQEWLDKVAEIRARHPYA